LAQAIFSFVCRTHRNPSASVSAFSFLMEESGFVPLVGTQANWLPARWSGRRSWGALGAVAVVVCVISAVAVAVARQALPHGVSFLAGSDCEVGIFDAYSWDAPPSCDGQEDGLRWIKPDADRALQVLCQSGWVLMQKRTGPSVNFYRNWMSYARGFGDSANFWLGNDNLNAVTSGGARLWVSLEDADNNWRYAAYENFSVASALENYMAIFEGYSGTAGDSLSYHNGSNFSTFDADNDRNGSRNCAEAYTGAWWYNSCSISNLNGEYVDPGRRYEKGIAWNSWHVDNYSMKSSYMWVQPRQVPPPPSPR